MFQSKKIIALQREIELLKDEVTTLNILNKDLEKEREAAYEEYQSLGFTVNRLESDISEIRCKFELSSELYSLMIGNLRGCVSDKTLFDLMEYTQAGSCAKVEACRSILGKTEIYRLFPEYDNLGYFEGEYDEILWRERDAFGDIVDSKFVGCYEFCTYEIDVTKPEYQEYRAELEKQTVSIVAERWPAFLLNAAQEYLVPSNPLA